MAKLFEYAIIFNPKATKEQQDKGEAPKSKVIVDVTRILCASDREALMVAARGIPNEYADRMELLDIAVRPF